MQQKIHSSIHIHVPHLSNKKIPVNKVNPVNHPYSQRDCFFMSLFYMILVIINRRIDIRIDKYPTNKNSQETDRYLVKFSVFLFHINCIYQRLFDIYKLSLDFITRSKQKQCSKVIVCWTRRKRKFMDSSSLHKSCILSYTTNFCHIFTISSQLFSVIYNI